jgi:hypothetical protein
LGALPLERTAGRVYKVAMFTRLGNLIARRPAVLVTVWLALLLAGAVWAVRGKPVPPAEVGSFLPPNAPHNRASQIVAEAFPRIWYNSVLVIIAHRAEGVTETDFAWMGELAEAARREIEAELRERNLHARADGSIVGWARWRRMSPSCVTGW